MAATASYALYMLLSAKDANVPVKVPGFASAKECAAEKKYAEGIAAKVKGMKIKAECHPDAAPQQEQGGEPRAIKPRGEAPDGSY